MPAHIEKRTAAASRVRGRVELKHVETVVPEPVDDKRLKELGVLGLVEIVVFVATVFIAYFYVWRRGGLDWD